MRDCFPGECAKWWISIVWLVLSYSFYIWLIVSAVVQMSFFICCSFWGSSRTCWKPHLADMLEQFVWFLVAAELGTSRVSGPWILILQWQHFRRQTSCFIPLSQALLEKEVAAARERCGNWACFWWGREGDLKRMSKSTAETNPSSWEILCTSI